MDKTRLKLMMEKFLVSMLDYPNVREWRIDSLDVSGLWGHVEVFYNNNADDTTFNIDFDVITKTPGITHLANVVPMMNVTFYYTDPVTGEEHGSDFDPDIDALWDGMAEYAERHRRQYLFNEFTGEVTEYDQDEDEAQR